MVSSPPKRPAPISAAKFIMPMFERIWYGGETGSGFMKPLKRVSKIIKIPILS